MYAKNDAKNPASAGWIDVERSCVHVFVDEPIGVRKCGPRVEHEFPVAVVIEFVVCSFKHSAKRINDDEKKPRVSGVGGQATVTFQSRADKNRA